MTRDFKISLSQEFYSDVVYLSQYDSNYGIVFHVTDKYSKATDIDNMTAHFQGLRSDGLGFQYNATASSDTVTFVIDTSLTAVSGTHSGEIVFYDGNGLYYGSANVQIVVEPATHTESTIDADVTAQQTLKQELQEIVNTAATTVGANLGLLSNLTTTDKSSAVAAINEIDADVSQLNADLNNVHDFALALKTSPYSYYSYGTPTAGRRIDAETGEAFDGSANYYAFEKYIEIPKGRIYFESESGASGNIVFYDADRNVVDHMGINTSFVQLIGNHYDNTLATYMRIGIYKSGGIGNTNFNFAYSHDDETEGKPLFRNVNTDQTSYKNNRLTSDFIYADEPMLVTSKDTSQLVFGVLLYDANKTLLKTYYLADARTINYVSVPKGHYFTVYCDAPNNVQIAPTTELLDVISIEKTDIGFFTFTYNTDFLQLSKVFVGTIENQYSESALLMHCDSYGSSGLYTYRVAFYPSADSDKPYLTTDAMLEDFFIPARTYFRIILKRRSGTAVVDDFKAISLKEIPYNTPEAQGIASLIGKTRHQTDSDVLASYYEDYMSSKISTISGLADSCQAQFIFLTDYHYGTYNNTHNARALLTRIVMGTPVNVMFNGGDTWTRGTGASSYGEAKTRLISGVNETTPNAPCNWFFALGNHETGLDGNLTTPMFSTKDMQRIMGGNVTGYDVMYDPASTKLAYWVDVDDIRYICTNVGLGTVGSDEAQANVKLFMAEALSTLNGKTAVVVGHVYYTGTSDSVNGQAEEIGEMIVAFNAKSEYNIGSYGNVNFANASGEVALWITGHRHKDVTTQLSDGTPVVITTSCNAGAELGGLDRTVGTVNENAFDVVSVDTTNKTVYLTRIGAGSDRSFTY